MSKYVSPRLQQGKPCSYLRAGFVFLLVIYIGTVTFQEILPYFNFEKESYGQFWDYRSALVFHIACVLTATIIRPFQFSKAFRNKYIRMHRLLGRMYLFAISIGTVSATYLSWTGGYKISFAWAFGLQALAVAWITTALMAYLAVMKRRMILHKE